MVKYQSVTNSKTINSLFNYNGNIHVCISFQLEFEGVLYAEGEKKNVTVLSIWVLVLFGK